jgi:hypothetical protein
MSTTLIHDFDADNGTIGRLYNGVALTGHGRHGETTFRIAPHSSTKKKAVPTKKGTTNPLYLMKFLGGKNRRIEKFSLEGTPQGHLYNGLRVDRSTSPLLSELRIAGIPGNSDINPGETFLLNVYRCSGVAVRDTELDGSGIGASGLGLNTCHGGLRVNFVTAHDLKYCKGFALWKQTGGGHFDNVESLKNAFGFGFERCDGTYTLDHVKFRGSTRADIHLANDGGQYGRAKIRIIDPDLEPGQRVKVLLSKTELGNPNRQTADDVTLIVKGKERRDLLRFVTRA